MRILFAGTPSVAVPSLRALHASDHEVAGVLTRPPAPVGRKRVLTPSPVHAAAEELGIPVYTGDPNSDEVIAILREVDCVAVVAYGNLIREPALSTPTHGWINLHFSLLPRWRGAAPVQYALMAGERVTGVSVFQIEKGLDTGPIFDMVEFDVEEHETAGDLLGRLAIDGAPILLRTLDAIDAGTAVATPQVGEPTTAPTLRSADAQIDWSQGAAQIAARIRGLTPVPGSWTIAGGQRFKIGPVRISDGEAVPVGAVVIRDDEVLVGTGDAPVALTELAPPGKKWMSARDWGRGLQPGTEIIFESAS